MHRRRALFTLLALTLLPTVALGATPPPSAATIEADTVEVDLDKERTHASGNARLCYQDLELRADDLTADRTSGDVEAAGDLHLVQGGRRLTGDSLEYNLVAATGLLRKARVVEQGVIITGEEILLSPTEVVASNALFSTCDRLQPH
ncbi:MAG: hypothetical protein MUQ65_01045, partial [Armatimonadetes bacterium]|nr:hypothetical protein [Armatimonadota bacterium]